MIRDIIAKRYAKAFFSFASEQGILEQATGELSGFSDLVQKHVDLADVLVNPVFEAAERKAILVAVADKVGVSANVRVFLSILIEKNKMKYLAAILDHLGKMVDEAEGILRVAVVSATQLDGETVDRLKQKLVELTRKEDVQLSVEVDESLIGGLITRFAGMVYDGSVRTQLNNLGENLIKEW
ncbi:MAG: ATP synthase F1 subunit delta [Deltaproteobacteria bacterium]|nr:ATP synthase F1 subunit delta [Candidatus Anaeroferrophillus wilburensis]MBN2889092.1 ATP synthase F1 subunit delta [Deltaproteobacteria bacterium]